METLGAGGPSKARVRTSLQSRGLCGAWCLAGAQNLIMA